MKLSDDTTSCAHHTQRCHSRAWQHTAKALRAWFEGVWPHSDGIEWGRGYGRGGRGGRGRGGGGRGHGRRHNGNYFGPSHSGGAGSGDGEAPAATKYQAHVSTHSAHCACIWHCGSTSEESLDLTQTLAMQRRAQRLQWHVATAQQSPSHGPAFALGGIMLPPLQGCIALN